jgi:hypothetical protein
LVGASEAPIDLFPHGLADNRRIQQYEHSTLRCGGQRGGDAQKIRRVVAFAAAVAYDATATVYTRVWVLRVEEDG